ncbi:MAG: ABC transporter substrate-binding protein [Nocardioides sp.]
MRRGRTWSGSLALSLLFVLALAVAGCEGTASSSPGPEPTSSAPDGPVTLTLGVFGNADEVSAYTRMADEFAPLDRQVTVQVTSWPTADAMIADLRAGAAVPDVFLADRRDLAWLIEANKVQPVDDLLDERGIDFGDDYPRSSLTAFGVDNRLQCMPYGISPQVIYYNTNLIDFDALAAAGGDVPPDHSGWSLDQFTRVAARADRPATGVGGVYVAPTLTGLAPFLYSAGGSVFDRDAGPTSLAFSTPGSRNALSQVLRVLRSPRVSLSSAQLAEKSPLEWFKEGKLAMLEGNRSLVPGLRDTLGAEFDVMPIPGGGSTRTVADATGLCLSRGARDISSAADLLAHAITTQSLADVAREGYLQPANQSVALSAEYLQPGRLPVHAGVFTDAVRSLLYPALIDTWTRLDQTEAPLLPRLFTDNPLRLGQLTRQIDQASQPLLRPPTPTPSPTASGSTGVTPSG